MPREYEASVAHLFCTVPSFVGWYKSAVLRHSVSKIDTSQRMSSDIGRGPHARIRKKHARATTLLSMQQQRPRAVQIRFIGSRVTFDVMNKSSAKRKSATATGSGSTVDRLPRVVSVAAFAIASLLAVRSDGAPVRTPPDQDYTRSFVAQLGREISLREAMAIALRRYPGRVLHAEDVRRGGRIIYEIRIIEDDGRSVRTVRIDAQTGRFITAL